METALLQLLSDILLAVDVGNLSTLVLLDLSAAFDTVDHGILRGLNTIGLWEQWLRGLVRDLGILFNYDMSMRSHVT